MSFGFSIGDFIAGARLAYTLGKALTDSRGSKKEYQELIVQLDVVHKVLLQVDQLRAANQLAQATVNALLFTVNAANSVMESFLDKNQSYQESLKPGGSQNVVKDYFRKIKWPLEMRDQANELKQSLITMLVAVNCLVSLACYHNTEYDPRCDVKIRPKGLSGSNTWKVRQGKAIKLAGTFWPEFTRRRHQDEVPPQEFEQQKDPRSFFRPGQIFMAQISSDVLLENGREFRKVDYGNLPLASVSKLKSIADGERLEDRRKRLAQIQGLPLDQMIPYCEPLKPDECQVTCLLCQGKIFSKEEWTYHFRLEHWDHYFSMLPEIKSRGLREANKEMLVPREKLKAATKPNLTPIDNWITIEDVTVDAPIQTDDSIVGIIEWWSPHYPYYLEGPVMIQRFVVIEERDDSCLCVGIHTYARQGCGNQTDQELFSVIHAGKEPPEIFPNEKGIVLSPIRMKPLHPSTALPRSARIHYGRAYKVYHQLSVRPMGQIHPTSMETLLDQFEANVFRIDADPNRGSEEEESSVDVNPQEESQDTEIAAADMNIVQDMRQSITTVVGPNLSPEANYRRRR